MSKSEMIEQVIVDAECTTRKQAKIAVETVLKMLAGADRTKVNKMLDRVAKKM